MYYVYFLKSLIDSSKTYAGYTADIQKRLEMHNAGRSTYTDAHKPWELVSYVAFATKEKAIDFEKYTKAGSGYAFAKKRFW